MTHDTIQALAGLPHWPCTIEFYACTWPLEPSEYRSLAQHVPLSFTNWELSSKPVFIIESCRVPEPVVECVCAGLRERRQGLGLPTLSVKWGGAGMGEREGCMDI